MKNRRKSYFVADLTISSYVNSLRMFLEAKYAPPLPDCVANGEEKEENLLTLLTFFATKTEANNAAKVIPIEIVW